MILLGLSSRPASFMPLKFVREGLRVSGSIIYDHPGDFARAIALVERKVLSPSRIISQTFPFNEVEHALQDASTGESAKVLLNMEV